MNVGRIEIFVFESKFFDSIDRVLRHIVNRHLASYGLT